MTTIRNYRRGVIWLGIFLSSAALIVVPLLLMLWLAGWGQ